MIVTSTRDLAHRYYDAWAHQDRSGVQELLSDDLDFRSAQDRFTHADEFLAACWQFSEGLTGVTFLKEVYSQGEGFVILRWQNADGSSFADAEYVRVRAGRISEILVVNNSPSFGAFATSESP